MLFLIWFLPEYTGAGRHFSIRQVTPVIRRHLANGKIPHAPVPGKAASAAPRGRKEKGRRRHSFYYTVFAPDMQGKSAFCINFVSTFAGMSFGSGGRGDKGWEKAVQKKGKRKRKERRNGKKWRDARRTVQICGGSAIRRRFCLAFARGFVYNRKRYRNRWDL